MNNKIRSIEFISMIPLIISNSILGSSYLYLYNYTNKSAVISMLIGLIISIIFLFIIFKVFNILDDKTIIDKIKYLFPKTISYIFNIVLILISLTLSSLILFRLVMFFHTQFTGSFSKYSIAIILFITTYYLTSRDIKTILRFSNIVIFICLIIFLFDAVSLIPSIKIDNMIPIIDTNYKNILTSSLMYSIQFSGPSFLILIIKKKDIKDKIKLKKYIIITYIISGIILLLMNIITLCSLGIELIKLYTYPIYIVLKKIKVFKSINSIENISVLMWFFILIFSSSLSLYFSKESLIKTFNIKNRTIKNIIILIMNLFISFIPLIIFNNKIFFDKPNSALIPVIIYIIVFIILIITLIKKKLSS